MRKARGADLAYLESMPAAQAGARRFVHEADLDAIATARAVAASKREGRRQRQKLPKVKSRIRTVTAGARTEPTGMIEPPGAVEGRPGR